MTQKTFEIQNTTISCLAIYNKEANSNSIVVRCVRAKVFSKIPPLESTLYTGYPNVVRAWPSGCF